MPDPYDIDLGPPSSYIALARGVPVITSDGEEIGTVRKVLAVHVKDVFDGIVVRTPAGDRFVDGPEVERIYERGVVLSIDAAAAAELPKPDANPLAGSAQQLLGRAKRRVGRGPR